MTCSKYKVGDRFQYDRGINDHTIVGINRHTYIIESEHRRSGAIGVTECNFDIFHGIVEKDRGWKRLSPKCIMFLDKELFEI